MPARFKVQILRSFGIETPIYDDPHQTSYPKWIWEDEKLVEWEDNSPDPKWHWYAKQYALADLPFEAAAALSDIRGGKRQVVLTVTYRLLDPDDKLLEYEFEYYGGVRDPLTTPDKSAPQ